MPKSAYTLAELRDLLREWERELLAENKTVATVHTYTDRTRRFLGWLEKKER